MSIPLSCRLLRTQNQEETGCPVWQHQTQRLLCAAVLDSRTTLHHSPGGSYGCKDHSRTRTRDFKGRRAEEKRPPKPPSKTLTAKDGSHGLHASSFPWGSQSGALPTLHLPVQTSPWFVYSKFILVYNPHWEVIRGWTFNVTVVFRDGLFLY